MQIVPQKISGIRHPLISDMYVKSKAHKNILVIDTRIVSNESNKNYGESYQTDLEDFLMDLPNIRSTAESQIGKVDQIDVKTH